MGDDDGLTSIERKEKQVSNYLRTLAPLRTTLQNQRPPGRLEAAGSSRSSRTPSTLTVNGMTYDESQFNTAIYTADIILLEEQVTKHVQLENTSTFPSQTHQRCRNVRSADRLHKKVEIRAGCSGSQSDLGVTARKITSQNSNDEIVLLEEQSAEPILLEDRRSTPPPAQEERFNESTADSLSSLRPSSSLSSSRPSSSLSRPRSSLKPLLQEKVYVEVLSSAPWKRGRVEKLVHPPDQSVKYQIKVHSAGSVLVSENRVAYWKPLRNTPMAIGTRVIACPHPAPQGELDEYYPGLIAQSRSPDNRDRYLVIFNRGDACYLLPQYIRLVCDLSKNNSSKSLCNGNRRIDVRTGDKVKIMRDTSWQRGVVLTVDCSIAKVKCRDGSIRWCFLSDRFIKKGRKPDEKLIPRVNISAETPANGCSARVNNTPKVNNTSSGNNVPVVNGTGTARTNETNSAGREINNLAAGESPMSAVGSILIENILLPVDVPRPKKRHHVKCRPSCISWVPARFQNTRVVDEERGHDRRVVSWNPLAVPLLQGWRRKVYMEEQAVVRYTTPCGKWLWSMQEIFSYLRDVESSLTMDFFDFDVRVRPLARFKVAREDRIIIRDLSNGKESVPISVYNDYDDEFPRDFRYWLSYAKHPPTDPKFLLTCSCNDGCFSSITCSCLRISFTEMKTLSRVEEPPTHCYNFRRLLGRIDSGVFECNSWCQCPSSCLNRVAQNPLSLELQVFKTPDKGWGVRCMYDIPHGSFITTYSGEMLSDTDAETEGLQNGDEYFVELDYQQVAEHTKDDYENGPEDLSDAEDLSPPIAKKANIREEKTASDPPRSREYQTEATSNFVVNAKHRGNISRFLNHSCDPNVFAQNVFIDSQDLRVPRVALFASKFIPAGTELMWDYGYIPDSFPERELKCKCGSSKCNGRLL